MNISCFYNFILIKYIVVLLLITRTDAFEIMSLKIKNKSHGRKSKIEMIRCFPEKKITYQAMLLRRWRWDRTKRDSGPKSSMKVTKYPQRWIKYTIISDQTNTFKPYPSYRKCSKQDKNIEIKKIYSGSRPIWWRCHRSCQGIVSRSRGEQHDLLRFMTLNKVNRNFNNLFSWFLLSATHQRAMKKSLLIKTHTHTHTHTTNNKPNLTKYKTKWRL